MKYHWIGFYQDGKDKKVELKLPDNPETLGVGSIDENAFGKSSDEIFQPQIIQTVKSAPVIANMTKKQVTESCSQRLKRTINDSDVLMLAVGNCVLSNYRDPVIETRVEEGEVKSTKSRQAQIRKNNIIKLCQKRISAQKPANVVEKQLLLGICVSGTAQ